MGFLVTRSSFVPDTTPNAFTFTDQTDVALNTTITSAGVTIGGINSPTAITITNGTYDLNASGSFTSSPGTVINGDSVRARHTSSSSNSTSVSTTVVIGGVSDVFTSTTEAGGASYDLYRQSVYGRLPDRYCDPTKSLSDNSGDGLSEGTAWNQTQARANMSTAMSADGVYAILGVMPSGSSGVAVATTNDDGDPAWKFANNGTSGCPIVAVMKYSAIELLIELGRVGLASSSLRTEFKHTGTQPTISGGGTGVGTGCAIIGSTGSYHEVDGLFIDQSTAWMKEDSGNIRDQGSTNFKMRNFVIKGAAHTVASNCVAWRPGGSTGTVLSNFAIYDFSNDGTGSGTPQEALASDIYGATNFLVEHFLLDNIEDGRGAPEGGVGFYIKGDQPVPCYGTFRYGIVKNCANSARINLWVVSGSQSTRIEWCLFQDWESAALILSAEGGANPGGNSNVHIDHCSFVVSQNLGNYHGGVYIKSGAARGSNTITNCLFDVLTSGHVVDAGELASNHPAMSNNVFYRAGSGFSSSYNGADYTSISTWQTATGGSSNQHVTSDPLSGRGSGDYITVTGAAATASSTGGPVGVSGSPETLGYI